MEVMIEVDVNDEHLADPESPTGLTDAAHRRLTAEGSGGPLGWLGEVRDVRKSERVREGDFAVGIAETERRPELEPKGDFAKAEEPEPVA